MIENQRFDFGALAASGEDIIEIARAAPSDRATEARLDVALHSIAFGSASQLIEVRVFAVVIDADESSDFVSASALATVSIKNTAAAGQLLSASVSFPFGCNLRVEVRGLQPSASSTTFSAVLTVRLTLKRPPDVRQRPESTRQVPAEELVPIVLRARACDVRPEPDHLPFRYVGPSRPHWPWPIDPEAVLRWLPLIIEHDACKCADDAPAQEDERQPTRVFEQLLMRIPAARAEDANVVAFGEALAAEPVAMTRCGKDGDLLILWDRWSQNGPGPRPGALAPRGKSLPLQLALASGSRIRGGPAAVCLCARANAPSGEGEDEEFSVGFSTRPAVHARARFGVTPDLLPAVLDELKTNGWRPTSVTRHGSAFAPKYAMTTVRDDSDWRAELFAVREQGRQPLIEAHEQREVPVCVFELWGGGYGMVFGRSRHPRIPHAHLESDVPQDELTPTLRAFACEGWRVISLMCSGENRLDVVWTRDLWVDSRFRGLRRVAS